MLGCMLVSTEHRACAQASSRNSGACGQWRTQEPADLSKLATLRLCNPVRALRGAVAPPAELALFAAAAAGDELHRTACGGEAPAVCGAALRQAPYAAWHHKRKLWRAGLLNPRRRRWASRVALPTSAGCPLATCVHRVRSRLQHAMHATCRTAWRGPRGVASSHIYLSDPRGWLA